MNKKAKAKKRTPMSPKTLMGLLRGNPEVGKALKKRQPYEGVEISFVYDKDGKPTGTTVKTENSGNEPVNKILIKKISKTIPERRKPKLQNMGDMPEWYFAPNKRNNLLKYRSILGFIIDGDHGVDDDFAKEVVTMVLESSIRMETIDWIFEQIISQHR